MKEKLVTTINGERIDQHLCRKFYNKYYKIGDIYVENSGDCYRINDKFYRVETGLVVYDHSKKQYVLNSDNIIEGVIALENEKLIFGFFSKNKFNSVYLITPENKFNILHINIFEKSLLYREKLSDGNFYHIKSLQSSDFYKKYVPSNEIKHSLPYSCDKVLKKYIHLYEKVDITPTKHDINISKTIGDLTFGFEFETTKGYIPSHINENLGLIPLRDGSISGLEYVTIPLSGSKGISILKEISKELQKRTDYNDTCSMHLHIGNIPRTKEFLLAFSILTVAIQDEIYKLFPLYKKYNFGIKNKNYSAPLENFNFLRSLDEVINEKNIDKNFDILFKQLSGGQPFSDYGNHLDNVLFHPQDPNGTHKWAIKGRYKIHNLIPIIFGNKKTIEFRIHTPTFNINKIYYFLILNSLLIRYTIRFQNEILSNKINKFNLSDIIMSYETSYNHRMLNNLLYYIENRRGFTRNLTREGKISYNEEIINANKIY